MIRYECIFKMGKAGYIELDEAEIDDTKTYQFNPYRSKSHLKLFQLVKKNKEPEILLKSKHQKVFAIVLTLSSNTIVVKKKPNQSLFMKIRQLFKCPPVPD